MIPFPDLDSPDPKVLARAEISTDVAADAARQAKAAGLKPNDLVDLMCTALISTMLKHSRGVDVMVALRELRTRVNHRIDRVMEISIEEPQVERILDFLRRLPADPA